MGFSVVDDILDVPDYSDEDMTSEQPTTDETVKEETRNDEPPPNPPTREEKNSPPSRQPNSRRPFTGGRDSYNDNRREYNSPHHQHPRDSRRDSFNTRYENNQSKNYSNEPERNRNQQNCRPRSDHPRGQRRYNDSRNEPPRPQDSRANSRNHPQEYNPLEQLQASKEEEKRHQKSTTSPQPRGNFNKPPEQRRSVLPVQKPKNYRKRELKIIGRSDNAPTSVTQPIKTKFGPLKDWRNFTLETDSVTFYKLVHDVRQFDDPQGPSRNDSRERSSSRYDRPDRNDRVDKLPDRRDRIRSDSRMNQVKPPEKLEFYLIYGEETRFQNAKKDGRWRMPRGDVEQKLNRAYNQADLVFVFFSDHILGCARVVSAIGFNDNEILPSCRLSAITERYVPFSDIPNFSPQDLLDGKQLSDDIGRMICSRVGLSLEKQQQQQQQRYHSSNTLPHNDRRTSRDRSSPRDNRHRQYNRRPNNYFDDHSRPRDMRTVDEGIIRSRLETTRSS